MLKRLKDFLSEESGQGMAEYGLILALVAVAVIAALSLIGDGVKENFNAVAEKLGQEVDN
jgi:pilus assembly protein Flp/PilA